MKTKIETVCLILILLACTLARAQGQPEVAAYQEAAGDRAILYRGKQAPIYNILANGHPYWSQTAFELGDMLFEGNFYDHVSLNIDAVAQLVLVRLSGSPFSVGLTAAQAPSFHIGERSFVGIGPGGPLPEGIYEVFGEGRPCVYKHVDKILGSSVNNVNGKIIGYYDDNYRNDVTRHFSIHTSYYFLDEDGNCTRFRTRGALIRHFPARRKEIRKADRSMRANVPDYDFDGFCKLVLNTAAQ